jgi:hypothetical protein
VRRPRRRDCLLVCRTPGIPGWERILLLAQLQREREKIPLSRCFERMRFSASRIQFNTYGFPLSSLYAPTPKLIFYRQHVPCKEKYSRVLIRLEILRQSYSHQQPPIRGGTRAVPRIASGGANGTSLNLCVSICEEILLSLCVAIDCEVIQLQKKAKKSGSRWRIFRRYL